jgi:hypothetical protein
VATIVVARNVVALPGVKSRAVGQFGKPARLNYTTRYDEFYRRRAMSGTSALFYTHEDLVKLGESDFSDIMADVPGLRLHRGMGLDRTELSFPGCKTEHILIKLDGQRVWPPDSLLYGKMGNVPAPPRMGPGYGSSPPTQSAGQDDPFELLGSLHIQNLEAMEVYKNVASLPVDAVGELCGAIYIWTR